MKEAQGFTVPANTAGARSVSRRCILPVVSITAASRRGTKHRCAWMEIIHILKGEES